jgi:hypothetical protein
MGFQVKTGMKVKSSETDKVLSRPELSAALSSPSLASAWTPPRWFCVLAKHNSGVQFRTQAKQFACSPQQV